MTEKQKDIKKEKDPVVQVAEEMKTKKQSDHIYTNANGIRFYMRAVASNLLRDSMGKIPLPVKQTYIDPNTKQEVINPSHPQNAIDEAAYNVKRADVSMDALTLFGIELVDGMPSDKKWLSKLVFMGLVDQSKVDNASAMELELYYKKYVVADNDTLQELSVLTGITGESVQKARDMFPGDA